MATKIVPSLETVEGLIAEVEEWHERVRKTRQKMTCLERGSDPYQDLLSELSVELDRLKMKAQVAAEAIDEYHESLPEGE
jgi:uncharacterized coiled-coil DUF342 family protein